MAITSTPPAGVVTTTGAAATLMGIVVILTSGVVTTTGFAFTTTSSIAEGPVRLFLDGQEIGGDTIEWDMTTEEILGGIGTGHLTVQDRAPLTSGWEPRAHMDVLVTIRSSGWVLYHGETLQPSLTLAPALGYRIWKMECQDYNAQFAQRLLGAATDTAYRFSVDQPYIFIDADAVSYATDKITVQQWIDHYLKIPYGTIDTSTYVFEYVDNAFLGAEENIMWLYAAYTDLQSALEELASTAEVNVQGWLMPDDKYAWLAVPTSQSLVALGDPGDLPAAPVALGVGGTSIMSLEVQKDGRAMPQVLFGQGATGYTLDPDTGQPVAGGSGWYPSGPPSPYQRQAYVSIPNAWTEERRDRLLAAAYRRGQSETIRMTITTQGVDGWRAGQYVDVTEPMLPPSMQDGSGTGRFVIQRVATALYAGTDTRVYTLDLGDGPTGRIAQYANRDWNIYHPKRAVGPAAKPITFQLFVETKDETPVKAGDRRAYKATPQNGVAEYWTLAGLPYIFGVDVFDSDGALVDAMDTDATVDPTSATSDINGNGFFDLVADTTRDDLQYEPWAYVTVTPAP